MRILIVLSGVLCALLHGGSRSAIAEGPEFGHVEKHGSGEVTLILVPCLGCDWRSWDEFMERNAERYTMYAITWPGMADTSMPNVSEYTGETPNWDYIIAAMSNLIKTEELRAPVLIGHSAAGPYVVQFAVKHPELVSKVVSVDATITNWDTFGYTRQQRVAWAEKEMDDVRAKYDNDEAWAKLNAPPKSISEPKRRAMYGKMWSTPPREQVLVYWEEWLKIDVGSMLPKLDVPLLAVYAIRPKDKDAENTKSQRRARFQRAKVGPNVTVAFIEESGHTIWEHQPTAFDAMIAGFVAGSKPEDE